MHKRTHYIILSLVFVLAIATSLYWVKTIEVDQTDYANLALGVESKPYYSKDRDGKPNHFNELNDSTVAIFNASYEHMAKGTKKCLILGNSQTHSINQIKPGNVNYTQLITDSLCTSAQVLAYTLPNCNLQEMATSFNIWTSLFKMDVVVLPVFMDDLREDGVRMQFYPYVQKHKFEIKDTAAIASVLNGDFKIVDEGSNEFSGLTATFQESIELSLNDKLDKHWNLWKSRPDVRGYIFNSLYNTRNVVFGINAQTKRKMIPQKYNKNFAALELILRQSKEKGIKVIVYIPPIRNDVEMPYVKTEYDIFKTDLKRLVSKYSSTANFYNFEDLVEGKYWGVKASTNLSKEPELDFMHFTYEGHKALFAHLFPILEEHLCK